MASIKPQDPRDVSLEPVAEPANTYVLAPRTEASDNLVQLAKGLRSLNPGLDSLLEQRQQDVEGQDKALGQQQFYKDNASGIAKGVQSGDFPSFASRAFVAGYKQSQGAAQGLDLGMKFAKAYDAWDKEGDYGAFSQQFIKQNLPENTDPQVAAGLMPHLHSVIEQGQSRYITDLHKKTVTDAANATVAHANAQLDADHANAITTGQPVNYDARWSTVMAERSKALATGQTAEYIDPKLIDMVTSQATARAEQDPSDAKRIVDSFFKQQVPGKDYTWGQQPYGQQQRDAAILTIDRRAREKVSQDAKVQKEADAKGLEDVTRRTFDAIAANPSAPIPEELIQQGNKYDGSFRTKMLAGQKTILSAGGESDPQAVTALTTRILKGDGVGAIRDAMDGGAGRLSGSDLMTAYRLQQDVDKAGPDVDKIMNGGTAKDILTTIRAHAHSKSATDLYDDGSMNDEGVVSSQDFKQGILAWRLENPKATIIEQEKAVSDIGRTILNRWQPDQKEGLDKWAYARPGGMPQAPGGGPQTVQQPAPAAPADTRSAYERVAPGFLGGQPAPVAPPAPAPVVVPPSGPAIPTAAPATATVPTKGAAYKAGTGTDEVTSWYQTLPPEQKSAIAQLSVEKGKTIIDVARDFKRDFDTTANPPQAGAPAQAPAATQPPGDGVSTDGIRSALTRALQPDAPVPDDVLGRIQGSIEQALGNAKSGSGPTQGNYTLATIKDNPKAAHILDFVGGAENSGKNAGNYNSYYGHAGNTKDLAAMNLGELKVWMRNRGTTSSATGRFQFMHDTLFGKDGRPGLVQRLGLDMGEKFTPILQDRLAIQLLKDRGYDDWSAGRMSDKAFAANLAKEWASIPDPKTGRSFYEGDGVNHATKEGTGVLQALATAKTLADGAPVQVADEAKPAPKKRPTKKA